MGESEKCVISAIGMDGKTITLEEPLKYKHISISQTFGTTEVETRAEVGRLTRNVKYQGSRHEEFIETIPACEKSFDSNQFATQVLSMSIICHIHPWMRVLHSWITFKDDTSIHG